MAGTAGARLRSGGPTRGSSCDVVVGNAIGSGNVAPGAGPNAGGRGCSASPPRVAATAFIVGRAAASGASMAMMTSVMAPARCGGVNSPEATRYSTAIAFVSVPNGGVPSTAAYRVDPRENTSDAKVELPPRATSGARNDGVPCTSPVAVSVASPRACEMPKSLIMAVPSAVIKMLPGLTSRCTMPTAWAASSAEETWAPILAVSSGGIGPLSLSRLDMGVDGRNCMIRHGRPSCSTTSNTGTACRWCSRAVILASRMARWLARSASAWPRPCCRWSCLTATGRFRRSSRASHTEPMPPRPTRLSSR